VSEQQRSYEMVPAAYRPPAVYANPGELVPVTSPRPAPVTSGSALRKALWASPLLVAAVPLIGGLVWHAHGGHSLSAWGVGALGAAGLGFAVTQRQDSAVATCVAGFSGLLLEFAIDAYSTEVYLPLGLFGLAAVAIYGVAARVRVKFAARKAKTDSVERVEQTRADATVEVARLGAWERVTAAAIEAQTQVRVAEVTALAQVQVAHIQATAVQMLSSNHPLLALSDTARAMLDGRSYEPAAIEAPPAWVNDAA